MNGAAGKVDRGMRRFLGCFGIGVARYSRQSAEWCTRSIKEGFDTRVKALFYATQISTGSPIFQSCAVIIRRWRFEELFDFGF